MRGQCAIDAGRVGVEHQQISGAPGQAPAREAGRGAAARRARLEPRRGQALEARAGSANVAAGGAQALRVVEPAQFFGGAAAWLSEPIASGICPATSQRRRVGHAVAGVRFGRRAHDDPGATGDHGIDLARLGASLAF
ncbi:MAG: hypothetical protein IPM15_01660 [Betaproteobacteria bacterium]|nr:hypothetical protein [Betaproteobacteria bacterium]